MSARTKKNTVETVEEQTTPAAQEEQSETPGDPATETEAAEKARKQEDQDVPLQAPGPLRVLRPQRARRGPAVHCV